MKNIIFAISLLLAFSFGVAGDYAVIVNKANDAGSISKTELKRIYRRYDKAIKNPIWSERGQA